jgi:hypothetical protein
MTKICLLAAMILLGMTACKKEQVKKSLITDNSARKAVSTLLVDTIIHAYDWSHTVQIAIVTAQASGEAPQVDVNVPPGYTLVGGGAAVMPQFESPGALLTASYPDSNFTTWHAASHDHLVPFYHTLVAYAIGIQLIDVPRPGIIANLSIVSSTSPTASHPNTNAYINPGVYTLLGGGAKVNSNTEGNFLVASVPMSNGWFVSSKDHDVISPATITAYAIGIRTQFLLSIGLETIVATQSGNIPSGFGAVPVKLDTTYVLTCPGAITSYSGAGRMLDFIQPVARGAIVGSQDLIYSDSGPLYAFALGIRRKR